MTDEADDAHDCPCGGTCPGPNADLQTIRAEVAEYRADRAEALVDELTDELTLVRDTLRLRTGAMHRVAQENDHLRSRLANQETTP